MKLVVTGGMGFIGSHFVEMLLARNHEVLLLDHLTYAANPQNLREDVQNEANFRKIDISDAASLRQSIQNFGSSDCIVNFAAESHVDRSIDDASVFVQTNVLGTFNVLEASRKTKIKTVVHVSTDEVYGSLAEGSADEVYPLDPNSPYASSKAASDLLARSYFVTHGLDVRITRCCNNYGIYQFPEKVIPVFVKKLVAGEKLPIYGDGKNVREWIHVSDHARAIQ